MTRRIRLTAKARVAMAAMALVMAAALYLTFGIGTSIGSTNVGGIISADTTWDLAGSPYIVTGNVLVQQGVTLTVEPGVEVRFESGIGLQVSGEFIARGVVGSLVVFTSNAASPAPGDWAHISFTDTATDASYNGGGVYLAGSIFEHCLIEYGGGAVISHNGAVRLDGAHPFINRCTIEQNSASGIDGFNLTGVLKVTNSSIQNNTKSCYGGGCGGRSGGGISVEGGTAFILDNTIANNTSFDYGGGIAVGGGSTATISGNIITGNSTDSGGGGIQSNSTTLVSNNTISNNTATDGGGIRTNAGDNTISNNTIRENSASSSGGGFYTEGGTGTLSGNTITGNTASVGGASYIENSTATLSDNIIAGNTASLRGGGIYIASAGATVIVSGNTIARNTASDDGGGIWISCCIVAVTLSSNTITGNISPISTVRWGSSGSAFDNNLFGNDAPYLVYNARTSNYPDANMESNWWGTTNSADIAESIYDWFDDPAKGFVIFTPFLNQPNTGAPVSPPVGVAAIGDQQNLSIDLSWAANPEGDVVGYKVYYDTDGSGFPYDGTGAAEGNSPVDVGNVTNATLSGLPAWVKYYIAITAYDADGNESWYSAEAMAGAGVDNAPPYTSGHAPAPGDVGVPVGANVVVHVLDDDAGVDQASIMLTVEGVDVTGQAIITGTPADYTLTYNPSVDFPYAAVIDVTVDASDLASPANPMATDSYSFTTLVPLCKGVPATIVGTSGPDSLSGTPGPDVIVGLDGDDAIWGFGGNDLVCAGPGEDFVDGGPGVDRVYGQAGNDDLKGGFGNDWLRGGGADDVLRGGKGRDRLFGDAGHDVLLGGNHDDVMRGGSGDDVLLGQLGDDNHLCGPGYDYANGGPGFDGGSGTCEATWSIP